MALPEWHTGWTALGMKFGLWIEPEMVSQRQSISTGNIRTGCWGRRTDVRARAETSMCWILPSRRLWSGIGDMMEEILSGAPVSYIKWDMNRSMI